MSTATLFDIEKDLEAEGGDDTLKRDYTVDCQVVDFQYISDGSQKWDVVVDVRLSPDAKWTDNFESDRGLKGETTGILRVTTNAIRDIRIRVVNDDQSPMSVRVIARAYP